MENGALNTVAVNLRGDLVFSVNGQPSQTLTGPKDKVNGITAAIAENTVYFASETFAHALRNGSQTHVSGVTTDQKMDVLVANEHSVFAGSNTGFVHKINGDAVTETTKIEGAKILDMGASNDNLYVLSHRKEIHEVCANTLTVKRAVPITYDGRCLCYIKATGEVWVGDKTGTVHVLNAESLEQVSEFVAHPQQPVDVLSVSADSARVATGEHKRYVKVWNATDKTLVHEHGHHKNFIVDVVFTPDGNGVASISDDHSLVVCDLSTKKFFQVPRIHADRRVNSMAITADKTIYTTGDDCQVREWPACATWDKIPA